HPRHRRGDGGAARRRVGGGHRSGGAGERRHRGPVERHPGAIEKAVEDRLGDVVSVSFGLCERKATAETEFFDVWYAIGNARGQTVVVASGDSGANACGPSAPPAVNSLAASPHAVAVGGPTLDPRFDSAGNATGYGGEIVWNAGRTAASGGGESLVFARPRYQIGLGVPPVTARMLPVVALAANPDAPGYV